MARRGENIYKRKDGRYEGRYIKQYDVSGKAISGYVYSKNYNEIKDLLAKYKIVRPVKHGKNTLLADWLEIWLYSQSGVKPTTKSVYASHINNYINPVLGDIPLKKLNSEILQDFINSLVLSPATIRAVFSILKSALSCAEDNDLIANVWTKVKVPKREKSIVRILSVAEQRKLEKQLQTDYDIGIWLSLYAGLRIGEVCALKWTDVNLETSVITVNTTQARTENGLEYTSPKSKSSKREIPIPELLWEKLNAIPCKSFFVLSQKKRAVDIRTYRRYFKKILKFAELPDIKFHSLRHTFSTRALEVGMDYKTLSEILGHSGVGITLDLYAHSLQEHKRNEMNKLSRIFQ